ncbi:MAG: DNA-binding protein [Ardenticatenaceae bacterium]
MRTYRTLDAIEEEYFTNHPEEIDDYLNEVFAEYAKDGNSAALFSSLRVIARVKGIKTTTKAVGMTLQSGYQTPDEENPRIDNVNSIMQAIGYQLMPQRLQIAV